MFGTSTVLERNGLPVIELATFDRQHRVEVYLHGATVTSWIQDDEEKLYFSSLAVFDGVKALRGGIPLVFPQFARPNQSMPQHGFLRTSKWTYLGNLNGDDSITGFFFLSQNELTTNTWPFQFTAVYEVTLTTESLTYTLRIFNTDEREFNFQALLHSYIRVPRIEEIEIKGLQGWEYYDKVDNNQRKREENPVITIHGEVDRIYIADTALLHPAEQSAQVDILLQSRRFLSSQSIGSITSYDVIPTITLPDSSINLKEYADLVKTPSSLLTTDVVVWNAWEEKSRALDDLDNDAYLQYVCIEPGLVSSTHLLQPKQSISLSQKLF